jgi:hypothetical protein
MAPYFEFFWHILQVLPSNKLNEIPVATEIRTETIILVFTEDTLQNEDNKWNHDPYKKKNNALGQSLEVHNS